MSLIERTIELAALTQRMQIEYDLFRLRTSGSGLRASPFRRATAASSITETNGNKLPAEDRQTNSGGGRRISDFGFRASDFSS